MRFVPDNQEYRDARAAFWRAALDRAGVEPDMTDDVAAVLSELFPRFQSIWQGKKPGDGKIDGQRIAHDAYFDRYVLFGVPPEDIRDSAVRHADGRDWGEAAEQMALVMAVSPALIIEKLDRELVAYRPIPIAVYRWLAHLYDVIPPDGGILSPLHQFEVMVARHLRSTPKDALDEALDALSTADSPLLFLDALRRSMSTAASPDPTVKPVTLDADQRTRISERVRAYLARDGIAPRDLALRNASVMWTWLAIDEDGFKAWVSSARPPLDDTELASMLIGTSHPLGVPNPPSSLQNLDIDLLGRFIDLEAFRQKYAAEIASATSPGDTFFGWPDSPDERRRFVFWNLRTAGHDD
jgi:hypothetical protein